MALISAEIAPAVTISGTSVSDDRSHQVERIDLMRRPVVKPRCPSSSPGEIVVCAPDQEEFRLRPLPQTYESTPTDAVIGLGENASAGVAAEAASVGGWTSNRIMVRLKLKL